MLDWEALMAPVFFNLGVWLLFGDIAAGLSCVITGLVASGSIQAPKEGKSP